MRPPEGKKITVEGNVYIGTELLIEGSPFDVIGRESKGITKIVYAQLQPTKLFHNYIKEEFINILKQTLMSVMNFQITRFSVQIRKM